MAKRNILGAITGFETVMCSCDACPSAEVMLRTVSDCGVRFLRPKPTNPDLPDEKPSRRIQESGSIIVPLTITHERLGRDIKLLSLGWQMPLACLGYLADSQSITIDQTNSPGAETLEEIVDGQIALALNLAPQVKAAYGWVDKSNVRGLPRVVAAFSDVKYWFYFNLFGPKLVAGAPRDFFSNLPAYEKQTLPDGSLAIRSTGTYAEWVQTKHPEVASYLSERAPRITLSRRRAKKE